MNILIVDDDQAIADSLAEALEKKGVFCTAVYDGKSALEQLSSAQYDIVFLDLILAEKNGIEV